MNTQTQLRFASTLVVAPFIVGTIVHLLGGRSLTTALNYASAGPIFYPTRFSLEIYGPGVILLPIVTVGVAWLACIALQRRGGSGRTQSA